MRRFLFKSNPKGSTLLNREEMVKLLRNCPVFWSRLGFCYDPPRADAQGRQIIFNRDFARYRHLHDVFQNAGVTLHTCILHSGWIGDGQYDFCDGLYTVSFEKRCPHLHGGG